MEISLNNVHNPRLKEEIIDLIDQMIREDKRKAGKQNDDTSTKQQILILHYLGIIPIINLENTKKAILFSKLLNRNEENIRKYLTYVNALKIKDSNIKTEDNLEAVLKLFVELDLTNEIELVKNDLNKI